MDFATRGDACLDMVFTNRPDLFGKCIPYNISTKTDHTAFILPAGTKIKPVRQKVCIHDCRKHRKGDFCFVLAGESWDGIVEVTDVDQAVNILETLIRTHMDRCMPFRMVSMSSHDPEWMTPLVKSLMRTNSKTAPTSLERIREINSRISDVISHNRRRLLQTLIGSRDWWKNVDNVT